MPVRKGKASILRKAKSRRKYAVWDFRDLFFDNVRDPVWLSIIHTIGGQAYKNWKPKNKRADLLYRYRPSEVQIMSKSLKLPFANLEFYNPQAFSIIFSLFLFVFEQKVAFI